MAQGIMLMLRNGVVTDDTRQPSLRYLMKQIEYYRAKAISDWSERHKFEPLDPQLQSDLGCIPLVEVDMAECECVKWGCNVKKAVLPKFMFHNGRVMRSFVGLIDKRTPIIVVANPATIKAKMSGRFSDPNAYYGYFIGQNFYVVTRADMSLLCFINARGWLETPSEEAAGCFDIWSEDYPIDLKFMPFIIRSIIEEYMQVLGIPHDEKNNANHN